MKNIEKTALIEKISCRAVCLDIERRRQSQTKHNRSHIVAARSEGGYMTRQEQQYQLERRTHIRDMYSLRQTVEIADYR